MSLALAQILEKNKLASDGAYLVLLQVTLPDATVLRFARNTEDVSWNGETWTAFPFTLEEINDAKEETPKVEIKVSNVTRAVQYYLEQAEGGVGSEAHLYCVNSNLMEDTTPIWDGVYTVTACKADNQWVSWTLGASSLFRKRFPKNRVNKLFCRFRFKGDRCGYAGAETACNKTLARCRELNNSVRFGGFPGISSNGVYV